MCCRNVYSGSKTTGSVYVLIEVLRTSEFSRKLWRLGKVGNLNSCLDSALLDL